MSSGLSFVNPGTWEAGAGLDKWPVGKSVHGGGDEVPGLSCLAQIQPSGSQGQPLKGCRP